MTNYLFAMMIFLCTVSGVGIFITLCDAWRWDNTRYQPVRIDDDEG